MEHAVEVVVGVPLVSLSGALVGGWLAMVSFVVQGRVGPEDRGLIRSLVVRSMAIGLVLAVIAILQEARLGFPIAMGFRNCATIFVVAMAISGIYASWWIASRLWRQ